MVLAQPVGAASSVFNADDDDDDAEAEEQKRRKLRKIEYTDDELRAIGLDPAGSTHTQTKAKKKKKMMKKKKERKKKERRMG